MKPFARLESTLAPLPIRDVDTDQIIPARYLKITDRAGLAEGLFSNWRDDPDFVLNDERYQSAQVLLAGDNFGCGSSREHAPWALLDHGFRAVISTRFADIFSNNSLKNGLLTVVVEDEVWTDLLETSRTHPSARVTIDLEAQMLHTPDGREIAFEVDPLARQCMLRGTDQFGYLLEQLPKIEAWTVQHPAPIDTRPVRAAADASR